MKRTSIQNILVPIDFSKMSIQAIEVAKQLARRFGATIRLAHVHRFGYAADFSTSLPPVPPFSTVAFEQDVEKLIADQLSALATAHGLSSMNCRVLNGGPAFDEICRFTGDISADLIVMPTHGYTGLKHMFLGSTAERVVRHSPSPVLVIREKQPRSKIKRRFSINTILVPVDFSDCSREGVRYAVGFAKEFGARVILLHATYLGYIYSSEGTAIYDIHALQEAAREIAEHQMQKLVREAKFGHVKFETVLTTGSPALDICEFANDHDVDLIITSTHGVTGLQHALIGSVAEQVVRHAPCAVLVVPSHPQIRIANLQKPRRTGRRKTARNPGQRRSR